MPENPTHCYVVETTTLGFPQYLDGFNHTGEPVWKSDLQNIDPFVRRAFAASMAKEVNSKGSFNASVRPVIIDDNGDTKIL